MALAKNMIEPKRKFTDTARVWDKFRAKKSGGPGGMLQLTLVQARELRCGQGLSFRVLGFTGLGAEKGSRFAAAHPRSNTQAWVRLIFRANRGL